MAIWLKDGSCFGIRSWTDALTDANTLSDGDCGLTDGSVAGDWRLPNIRELQSLIDFNHVNPAFPTPHPFSNVGPGSGSYWSSTTYLYYPFLAWRVSFSYGGMSVDRKNAPRQVWPVRGGR